MSRSKRDQRGKRIAKEIGGARIVGHTAISDSWDEHGSPAGKRYAKKALHRAVRRLSKADEKSILNSAVE